MSAFNVIATLGISQSQCDLWDAEESADNAAANRLYRSFAWSSYREWGFLLPDGSYAVIEGKSCSDVVMQIDRIANRTGWRFA